jgi:hypothetical protein
LPRILTRRAAKTLIATVAVIGAAIAGPVAGAGATPPIWEPNFGPAIPVISEVDDSKTTVPMGTFSFPFYGVTHAAPETFGVSSNGLIEFGAGNTDNIASGEDARTGGAKIAALWADLNPSIVEVDGGAVYGNGFNDDGDPAIDRFVFTWDAVFFGCEEFVTTCRALAQVQLFDTGKIVFGYNGVLTNQAVDSYGGAPIAPTIAQGGFVKPPVGFIPPPPGVDFSEMVPFLGGNLIMEIFNSEPISFDLDQNNLVFEPSGAGFQVTSTVPFNKPSEAPAEAVDKKKPKAKLKGGKQDLDKVLSSGLKLQLNCNEACFADVTVAGKSPKVKKAGKGSAELGKKGKRSFTVKLNKAAHDALARASSATFKVTATVFDEAGNKTKVKSTVKAK